MSKGRQILVFLLTLMIIVMTYSPVAAEITNMPVLEHCHVHGGCEPSGGSRGSYGK